MGESLQRKSRRWFQRRSTRQSVVISLPVCIARKAITLICSISLESNSAMFECAAWSWEPHEFETHIIPECTSSWKNDLLGVTRGVLFSFRRLMLARVSFWLVLSLSIGVTLSTFLTWNSLQFIFSVVLSSVMSVREYGGHLLNAQHSIAKHTIDIVQPHPQLFVFSQFLDECRGFKDIPTPTVPDDISVSTEVVLDINAELSDSNASVSVISKTTDFFVEDVGTFFRYISNIMPHTVKTFLRRQKLIYTSLPAFSSFDIRFHTFHKERGATFQTQTTCADIHSFQHPPDNSLHPPIYLSTRLRKTGHQSETVSCCGSSKKAKHWSSRAGDAVVRRSYRWAGETSQGSGRWGARPTGQFYQTWAEARSLMRRLAVQRPERVLDVRCMTMKAFFFSCF